ncbi:hypothetical protein [uncultured Erythrobacter sp.]|uniref:hypothetical protein n=1 Tax=uncultured Erythrobacter sp. TaxID=263913 RepID=UPI002658E2B4|nr:hypothetical protein [uncultured Erythrobacter sp.]
MRSAGLTLAASALLLGACAGGSKPAPARPPASAQPRSTVVRVPEVMAPKGLEGVIGASAEALLKRFGTPRIDLVEGDARKLQFAGAECVLDIFIYPVSAVAKPTATHVVARMRQGGAAADPGACIREVDKR